MTEAAHQTRLDQILNRLETRSRQCPGMFPVSSQIHWHQLALLHEPACTKSTERLWQTLEAFDREPALAHQTLNRLLAQQSPVALISVDEDPKVTAHQRLKAISALLEPQDVRYNKNLG